MRRRWWVLVILLWATPAFGQPFTSMYTNKDQDVSANHNFTGRPTGDNDLTNWQAASGPQSVWRLTANNYPVEDEFSSGVAPIAQGLMAGVNVPASSTLIHGAGLAGYGRSRSAVTGAVGVFGQGMSGADGNSIWGGNFVTENRGFNVANMWGIEVDTNQLHSPTAASNAVGISVTGGSDSQASGTFAGIVVFPAGIFQSPAIKWKNAFLSSIGSASNGITLFPQDATGASPAQDINLYGTDGANLYLGHIGTTTLGTLQLSGNFGITEITGGTSANTILQTSGSSAAYSRWNASGAGANLKLFEFFNFGGSARIEALNDDTTVKNVYFHFDANGGIRVAGTDPPVSTLHVPQGKYFQAEQNTAGPPPSGDCDSDTKMGRLSIDTTDHRLYVCAGASRGWDYAPLTD